VQLARRFAHRTGSRHHRDKARLNYDPFKDLTPVAVLARAPIVVVTAASSPCQTVDDLLAAARARPEAVRYATHGSGTAPHLSGVLLGYLRDEMQPCLEGLGFQVSLHANPVPGGGPFLIARRIEDAALPTEGDRRYGRGTADNKGQHSVVPGALAHVLRLRGQRPGYNLTVLLEMGEEAGSPGLAGFCAQQREALRADLCLASDGPRVHAERPTLFLGSRGALNFSLKVQPRPRCCCRNLAGSLPNDIFADQLGLPTDWPGRPLRDHCAGSRSSQRIASIAASSSGESCVPQASRSSSSCASEVTPMMVLATRQER
jgi:hypothetical protein